MNTNNHIILESWIKMKDGFIKVATATPEIRVGDCEFNTENIITLIKKAEENDASIIVLPELCITAYTCGDLFLQQALLENAEKALFKIAKATEKFDIISVVGLPIRYNSDLYNCGAIIQSGEIKALIPKINIPNYSEFYEARHFASGKSIKNHIISIGGQDIPFGWNYIFADKNIPELKIGIEICEDLWVSTPPSNRLAECGATIICNLSASDEVIGKAAYRRSLVQNQSARLVCGYIYADAGTGESTTDLIFAGHNIISENGTVLAESEKFTTGIIYGEIDIMRLASERRRMTTFQFNCSEIETLTVNTVVKDIALTRKFSPTPFVPQDKTDLSARCEEILAMQATGLATRLRHTCSKTAVLGLSGGLDSTLALIVTVHAFDMLGLDRKGIINVTMPCFGTTSRTKNNAVELAKAYDVSLMDIDIGKAVIQHFSDIGQNSEVHDVTYENSQARERTQILMDIANQRGGLVVGTGDLSELALGWATYNGDHMSMYAVNASIPKTLVRHLTAYEAGRVSGTLKDILLDILDTPVSPELLPPSDDGKISQKTEELVGPYELHDFFLYYFMRFGFPPHKIFRIACHAFDGVYTSEVIKKWLTVFIKRFFSQQFKRSCLPDGPKVGTVTLSPRGDFRMPSDAAARLWLEDIDNFTSILH